MPRTSPKRGSRHSSHKKATSKRRTQYRAIAIAPLVTTSDPVSEGRRGVRQPIERRLPITVVYSGRRNFMFGINSEHIDTSGVVSSLVTHFAGILIGEEGIEETKIRRRNTLDPFLVTATFREQLTPKDVAEFLKRLFKLTDEEYREYINSTEKELFTYYQVRAYKLTETGPLQNIGPPVFSLSDAGSSEDALGTGVDSLSLGR
jgi:hypothetical protein